MFLWFKNFKASGGKRGSLPVLSNGKPTSATSVSENFQVRAFEKVKRNR